MSKVENAATLAEQIAYDDSHGYKWGGWGPEYDCGHLIIDAFERAGIPVKSVGGASWTGNMPEAFMRCGAADVTKTVNLATGAGLKRGDVLVNRQNHAALYVGNGQIIQARTDLDGKPGDSSGQEIRKQAYYNYPWTHVLRFSEEPEKEPGGDKFTLSFRYLQKGCKGEDVRAVQRTLKSMGFDVGRYGLDGDYGNDTLNAVRSYQRSVTLEPDGIVGPATLARMMGVSV